MTSYYVDLFHVISGYLIVSVITVHFVYSFSADLINIDVSLNVLCVVFISFAKNPYMTNL